MPVSNRLRVRSAHLLGLGALLLAHPAHAGFVEQASVYGIADGDSMSYGASFADIDGDNDPDFYVNNHWKGPASFFLNDGAGSFLDDSGRFGSGNGDRHDQLWADLNNDGLPDQYIIKSRTQENELWWNLGWAQFTNGAAAAGVEDLFGRGREVTIADFDGDHYLDIFVVNDFLAGSPKPSPLFWNNGDGTFTRHPNVDDLFRSRLHCSAIDYDQDGDVDIVTTNPPWEVGEFYVATGGTIWTDQKGTVFPGINLPLGQAQGLSWGDFDNDGWFDLLACGGNRGVWDNATLESDHVRWFAMADSGVYKDVTIRTNGTQITFDAIDAAYNTVNCYYGGGGLSTQSFPLVVSVVELSGEPPAMVAGDTQGVFLWRTLGPGPGISTVRLRIGGPGAQSLEVGGTIHSNGSLGSLTSNLDPPPGYADDDWTNRLYRNLGDGTFEEVTQTAFDVNDDRMNSKGAAWGDFDNDGYIDIYVSNGGTVDTGNQQNYLYRNDGDGTFTEVAVLEGVSGTTAGMSDGAAWADVNMDGSLDLFLDNGAEHPPFGVGPRELFINQGNANHWIQFQLRGLISNATGIGTRVRVVTAQGQQWRTLLGDSDNCFANEHLLHFGLGSEALIDTVEITWPSGQVDIHEFVGGDRRLVAIEGKPLRTAGNPHFTIWTPPINDTIALGFNKSYVLENDNFGGAASNVTVRYENCSGQPIDWLWVNPETTTVFPGGTDPFLLTVSTQNLSPGNWCAKVIFDSNSFAGPFTLDVSINVVDPSVGTPSATRLPDRFDLSLPRPNPIPSGAAATLTLALPRETGADVSVYDVTGRRLAVLVSGALPAGYHRVVWDGRDESGNRATAGVYLVRAVTARDRAVRKVLLLN